MPLCPDLDVRFVGAESREFVALSAQLDDELEVRYPGLSEDEPSSSDNLLVAVIAYRDGEPVGCAALRELDPGTVELKRMFVLPQGRRMGTARRMLEALEGRARDMGFSAVRLGTGVRQPEALSLYESGGYRPIPLFGEYEGATLCVCYEKALAPSRSV